MFLAISFDLHAKDPPSFAKVCHFKSLVEFGFDILDRL